MNINVAAYLTSLLHCALFDWCYRNNIVPFKLNGLPSGPKSHDIREKSTVLVYTSVRYDLM